MVSDESCPGLAASGDEQVFRLSSAAPRFGNASQGLAKDQPGHGRAHALQRLSAHAAYHASAGLMALLSPMRDAISLKITPQVRFRLSTQAAHTRAARPSPTLVLGLQDVLRTRRARSPTTVSAAMEPALLPQNAPAAVWA